MLILNLQICVYILPSDNISKLQENIINNLERDIDEQEFSSVLKIMKNNTFPGSNGFTVEFYKFFWNDLKIYIAKAVQHIFLCKHLSISQRLGIISCLPKGDKPRQFKKMATNNSVECFFTNLFLVALVKE